MRLGAELHSQLAIRSRYTRPANLVPASIELVMAIYCEAVVETGEHGLTPSFDCDYSVAQQMFFKLFKPRQTEVYGFNPFINQNSCDSVCRPANFGSLRHD